jgi:hypothetical protein
MLNPRLKTHVFVVVPVCSEIRTRLLRCGFEFAAPGQVDRGDGYVFLRKPVQNPTAVVEILARAQVTAWKRVATPNTT